MGWEDQHLWGFQARRHGQAANWSPEEGGAQFDAALLDVIAFLKGKPDFIYMYDFGDSWSHKIRVGKIQPVRDDRRYPYLVSGAGRCPPEDIGGVVGYQEFLQAFENPDSDFRQYLPGYFEGQETWDPEDAGLDARRAKLALVSD